MGQVGESLAERARRRRQELRLGAPVEASPPPAFDADLIPDVESPYREPDELDGILGSLDILDAYQRWCGKSTPKVGSKRESIMISCPNPDHPDAHPSAWLNSDKNVWMCAACDQGGDPFDIAAWHFGYNVPGYKTDGSFPELRRRMAEDLGYTVKRTVSGTEYVAAESEPEKAEPVVEPPKLALVTPLPVAEMEPEDIHIEWRSLLTEDTFMRSWMETCSKDDLPEEFFFWLGLIAIGMCMGDDVMLMDSPPVRGNLFVCLCGPSGVGKTRAIGSLQKVLTEALPYDHDEPGSTGVRDIPSPASAESLVDAFSKKEYDPDDPKIILRYWPVRGILRFEELSSLIGRASRAGNTLKPTLMEMYDGYRDIELMSRSAGYAKAAKPYCSTVTTTQPGAIKDLLVQADADSGFVNRFIFAMGRAKPPVAYMREPLHLDPLIPRLRALRTWCSYRRLVLTEDALARWEGFFQEVIRPMKEGEDMALMTRVDLTMKKLMLLFAVDERCPEVELRHVEMAIAMFPYLAQTYQALGSQIGVGNFEACRECVRDTVRKLEASLGKAPTMRELSRMLPRRYPGDLVNSVIKTMVSLEELNEIVKKPDRGPVTVRYSYVD